MSPPSVKQRFSVPSSTITAKLHKKRQSRDRYLRLSALSLVNRFTFRSFVPLLLLWFVSTPSFALTIAVIGTDNLANSEVELFKQEINRLFEGQTEIEFKNFSSPADSGPLEIEETFKEASSSPSVDMVLVLDAAANQFLGRQSSFSKPTFLPIAINARLSGFPMDGNSSGKRNLNYITPDFDFERELKFLTTVVPFTKAVLISDSRIEENLQVEMISASIDQAKSAGVELQIQAFTGDIDELKLASDIGAVLYGLFPSFSQSQIQELIDEVNAQGIPSFSLAGEEYVRLGALATNFPKKDFEKLARRIALHMQEVLLGTPASKLPIFFEGSKGLMLNMETSRKIRVAPEFVALSDATLINEISDNLDRRYSLTDVARLAVEENLALLAQRAQADAAKQNVLERRSGLLPQVRASVDYLARKDDTSAVVAGTLPEDTTDGSISFSQNLFVEENWAAYKIEQFIELSEQELLKEVELDIIQSAVTVYLNVLLEKTSLEQERFNLEITRENFRLARNRVDVGTQTAADLFRWESELANAQQAVLQATADFNQQQQNLNQILNRPINEEFVTSVESIENPELFISNDQITKLITNAYGLESLTEYFVELGLERSPELNQIDALLKASERELKSNQRSYWVPDVVLSGEVTSNFDETRAVPGLEADDNDWVVGLEFSLPLYEGGARKAKVERNELEIRQLELNQADLKQQVERDIRNNMASLTASFNSIPLAKKAENAAQKNYELTNNSYSEGAKSITDVLDAQEALINAKEVSLNSVYAFLIDLMNVQRSIGAFDFFLSNDEKSQVSEELLRRLSAPSP